MTGRELHRSAFWAWLSARPPRWHDIATLPVFLCVVTLLVLPWVASESIAAWATRAFLPAGLLLGGLLLASSAGTYRRISRDLKQSRGDAKTA